MAGNRHIGVVVREAIADEERSVQWVADRIGIPRSTLRRKLDGFSDFGVDELLRIAEALRVNPSDLLPADFQKQGSVA